MTKLSPRRSFLFACCAAVLAFAFSAQPAAAEGSAASTFVQNLGNTALMSLTSKDISTKTRESRVREILRNNFDIPSIGKFAMGTGWRGASEAQRAEYMSLFEDMIVKTYTKRFEDYSGQKLKVGKSVADGADFLVSSQVVQKDGPPVNLEWRVRNKDGGLRIEDVIVEGISMSLTQRSDFSAVMQSGGGKVEALLDSMRKRSGHGKG